jgi:hypothetical protein
LSALVRHRRLTLTEASKVKHFFPRPQICDFLLLLGWQKRVDEVIVGMLVV